MWGQSCVPAGALYELPSTYTHSTDREPFGFRAQGYTVALMLMSLKLGSNSLLHSIIVLEPLARKECVKVEKVCENHMGQGLSCNGMRKNFSSKVCNESLRCDGGRRIDSFTLLQPTTKQLVMILMSSKCFELISVQFCN
ncbi:hypothetical protein AVEN_225065-1 [Araneus ventricosus]|uniref:Uncharacterized protein n=1 Tax=Araneus ventricosus TaxID=182803 RepID=A0A4Y2JA75_ARAVE|nr:hypothetical protein AVEN_225065-1 [Araneus ventricosus]